MQLILFRANVLRNDIQLWQNACSWIGISSRSRGRMLCLILQVQLSGLDENLILAFAPTQDHYAQSHLLVAPPYVWRRRENHRRVHYVISYDVYTRQLGDLKGASTRTEHVASYIDGKRGYPGCISTVAKKENVSQSLGWQTRRTSTAHLLNSTFPTRSRCEVYSGCI